MRKLLRPQTALLLLGSAPRVTAGVLRLAGGAMRLLAERLDPGAQSSSEPNQPTAEQRTPEPTSKPSSRNGYAERRDEQQSPRPDADTNGHGYEPPPRPTSIERPPRPASAEPPPRPASAEPASRPTSAEASPPAHVSEEAELVGEFADPGAEGGAGAVVHVEAPWTGYEHMHADEIIDRLAAEPDTVVAVVELYEQTHRRRRTVLEAAPRELRRRATRPGGRGGGS